jgi:hypothetical protein
VNWVLVVLIRSGYYIAPAFDILLTAADMNLKNRIVRSELVYKITAGANGTKLLHLLSTPGSKISFGQGVGGVSKLYKYDWFVKFGITIETNPENVDACLKDNPDIIKMPNQVELSRLEYVDFNEPTRTLVRQLFIAEG